MKAKRTVRVLLNLFLLAVLVVSAGSFFLVEDLASIFTALAQNPYFSPVFFLLAHMLTGIFLFPSGILRAAGGSFFGLWYGLLVNLVGVCLGAVLGYLIARRLGAEAVRDYLLRQKYQGVLRYMKGYGGTVVFVLRVLPVLPFNVVNIIAGFVNIRFRTYLIATIIGSIPYTFVFTYFASSIFQRPVAEKIFPYFVVSFIAVIIFLVATVPRKKPSGPQTS